MLDIFSDRGARIPYNGFIKTFFPIIAFWIFVEEASFGVACSFDVDLHAILSSRALFILFGS